MRSPTFFFAVAVALSLGWLNAVDAQDTHFIRGDSNVDGTADLTDAIFTLSHMFLGVTEPECDDAADTDDSGVIDVTDSVFTLHTLFLGSGPIPSPWPGCGPDSTSDALTCDSFSKCPQPPPPDTELVQAGHLLNRIAYGPTPEDLQHVLDIGVDAAIEEQLNPQTIDDASNVELTSRLEALTTLRVPSVDRALLLRSSLWRYQKGTEEPPADWLQVGFDDSGWSSGVTSIGYGDGDDNTVLGDMRYNYSSVYLRKTFNVNDPSTIDQLVLKVVYDDSFIAYLNGVEVARAGISGVRPRFNVTAGDHEANGFEERDLTSRVNLLVAGQNLIAIQGHNRALDSSDFTIDAEIVDRQALPGDPILEYPTIEHVKASAHVRGIYSKRQLQVVLADFWENHFTTDYDKVAEYLDGLTNSDANDAMTTDQARREAANLEAREYEFFLENALGNFGDLLLYSATSPTMLIYLDNILSFAGNPNENYAREILELHSYGVDNGYTQRDIEQAARAFTGWNICKVHPADVGDPHADCGVQFNDTVILDLGSGWKYFKGTQEPSPGVDGVPSTAWTEFGFDDSAWLNGSTGIGYGDGDDATVLSDMRNNYLSVYLRREFEVLDPFAFHNLILEVEYDDGFVAYINGVEVGRSETMRSDGLSPPAFNVESDGHEVEEGPDLQNLNGFVEILQPGTNILAIQVHNRALDSSDLSCRPRLLDREIVPGSIENGDPNGVWSIHFLADQHDYGAKTLFPAKPYELRIPSKSAADPQAGYADATDLIDTIVNAAPTAEFICSKLIQKFVSDEVSPSLLADCIAAWNSTNPKGNLKEVMRTLLTSTEFWDEDAYRAKFKTPLEYVNSTVRALEGSTDGLSLVGYLDDMGMQLFTRDDPDGWAEVGYDWISTGGVLNRIKFAQDLTANNSSVLKWNTLPYLDANGLESADEIVSFFNDLFYQGTLRSDEEQLLIDFLTTDNNYNLLPFQSSRGDYESRVDKGVSLMLSFPHWNFQ